jgi:hypothetical protein
MYAADSHDDIVGFDAVLHGDRGTKGRVARGGGVAET